MKKHEFVFNGYNATVLLPDNFNGKWIWKTEFFYAFDQAEQALFDKGYDVVSTIHSGFETQMAFHEKWACAPCDFRHAESRTAGAWLQSSKPQPRT